MLGSADLEHIWLQRSISCLKGLMTVMNAKAGQSLMSNFIWT